MVSNDTGRDLCSPETQKLLKEKGLKCISELCDCGRHHRHQACVKNIDKVKTILERPGMKDCSTAYQNSYQIPRGNFARKIMRPLPRLRNPNPPPMDFRTMTNTEYIKHDDFEGPPKPIKLEDSYHGVSSKDFDGKTSYNVAFTKTSQPTPVKLTQPKDVARPKLPFSDVTTHKATFQAKKMEQTPGFSELPSFMGSILYPDTKMAENLLSVNQESYKGKYAPKSEFCGPREAAITLGMEGNYEHETVHRATYTKHGLTQKRSPRMKNEAVKLPERARFDAKTQAQSDFPEYEKGGFPARAKPCVPYPATINLGTKISQDFTTTNKEQYKGQWEVNTIKTKKKEERYTPPKEKFHTTTQTMADFEPKEISTVRIQKPVQTMPKSHVKLNDETSYKTHFPKYQNARSLKKYGDFHEQRFYLKPIQKFQGDSVTANDFHQHEWMRPRTSYKPKQEMNETKEEMTKESVYRLTYRQKEPQECAYVKYLHDHNKVFSAPKIPSV